MIRTTANSMKSGKDSFVKAKSDVKKASPIRTTVTSINAGQDSFTRKESASKGGPVSTTGGM